MQVIRLDASDWRNISDFYDALLNALKASSWHGANVNALLETMVWYDDINEVAPPYTVQITNVKAAPQAVADEMALVAAALDDAKSAFFQKAGQVRSVQFILSS